MVVRVDHPQRGSAELSGQGGQLPLAGGQTPWPPSNTALNMTDKKSSLLSVFRTLTVTRCLGAVHLTSLKFPNFPFPFLPTAFRFPIFPFPFLPFPFFPFSYFPFPFYPRPFFNTFTFSFGAQMAPSVSDTLWSSFAHGYIMTCWCQQKSNLHALDQYWAMTVPAYTLVYKC